MKEHGMIFQGWGVRAILAGLKTQTRRLRLRGEWAVGDRIWVKETFCDPGYGEETYLDLKEGLMKPDELFLYRGDNEAIRPTWDGWTPSIFMPRRSARVLLEITALREEPLQDISAEDCIAEGMSSTLREHDAVIDLRNKYRNVIESINGPGTWNANPAVRVVEFKMVTP